MRLLVCGAVLWAMACLSPVPEGARQDAGPDAGVDAGVRCVDYLGLPAPVCAQPAPVVCAGVTCAAGQECCLTTGQCFDRANASTTCPPQGTKEPGGTACASNADCAEGEFCMADDRGVCIGRGHCRPVSNCGFCTPEGEPRCQVCGCNGVTYESVQAACVAGARWANSGPCGTPTQGGSGPQGISCAFDAQCDGGTCCALNGRCYDPSQPWRCEFQPDASILNCLDTTECNSGAGGGAGGEQSCQGDGCGTPGICRPPGSTNDCGGDVVQVCGCDGTTYINACWAKAAGTRVVSQGACP